jgi:hypothetical protein
VSLSSDFVQFFFINFFFCAYSSVYSDSYRSILPLKSSTELGPSIPYVTRTAQGPYGCHGEIATLSTGKISIGRRTLFSILSPPNIFSAHYSFYQSLPTYYYFACHHSRCISSVLFLIK